MDRAQFIDAGPAPFCADREILRQVRFCGQDDGVASCPNFNNSSHSKCDTIPGDRFAFFPVGTRFHATHHLLESASRADLRTIDDAIRRLLDIIEKYFYR